MQIRVLLAWFMVLSVFLWGNASRQSFAAETQREEIPLWPGVAPGSEEFTGEEVHAKRDGNIGWLTGVSRPTLTVYLPAAHEGPTQESLSAGVVICPGGGYFGLAIDHEGHALAQWFCDRGIAAGVLKYRCGGGVHQNPVPLSDAQRALRLMRSRAEAWKIDPDKIGVAGFSAGGHLASTAGTRYDEGDPNSEQPIERVSSRANFMVLAYPVITFREGVTHAGSKKNLLGESPAADLVQQFSNELQVTADTGPTFLVHACDDGAVPVENSRLFYQALRKYKIPVEMHLYETGGHGFGMYRRDQPADRWPDLLEGWLKVRGLIP